MTTKMMMTTTETRVAEAKLVVGIDVGKTRLDASTGGGQCQLLTNDELGIGKLLAWLSSQPVSLVVCEPTDGTEQPSAGYLKTVEQLKRVEQKHQDSHRGYQHRVSTQLVKDHQIICIEDTAIRNLTRSAKGTAENPGHNVRQKAGLNRAILTQSWYGLRTKLEYKAKWYGPQFIEVPTHRTSPAVRRMRVRYYRQLGQPSGIPLSELRARIQRRHQCGQQYPAPRISNPSQRQETLA